MKPNRRCVMLAARRLIAAFALPAMFGQIIAVAAEDWPRFRGPEGAGVSEEVNLPVHWNDHENIAWKTPLPGFGTSSPVVVGNRIYLTCYSGYGLDANNPGREEDLKRSLLCLDRSRGEVLWSHDVAATGPEASYIDFLVLHGYASSTPAAEADRVYACFGKSGTRAFDTTGKQLWQADVGAQAHYWGSAASPVIVDDLLIVNAAVANRSWHSTKKRARRSGEPRV